MVAQMFYMVDLKNEVICIHRCIFVFWTSSLSKMNK